MDINLHCLLWEKVVDICIDVKHAKSVIFKKVIHRWLDSDLISNIILIFQTKTNTLYFSSIT